MPLRPVKVQYISCLASTAWHSFIHYFDYLAWSGCGVSFMLCYIPILTFDDREIRSSKITADSLTLQWCNGVLQDVSVQWWHQWVCSHAHKCPGFESYPIFCSFSWYVVCVKHKEPDQNSVRVSACRCVLSSHRLSHCVNSLWKLCLALHILQMQWRR